MPCAQDSRGGRFTCLGIFLATMQKSANPYRMSWLWPAFLLLTACNFWQLLHHVMWRDELQAWLIATESRGSLLNLWSAVQYEPQPGIWHLVLWLLSHLSIDPRLMQVFHFGLGTAAAALVIRYAPFTAAARLMIVMGYYLSFEYLLISRSYALGMLLLFLFCSRYEPIKQKPAAGGAVLGLLACTSTYGAVMSLALWGGLTVDLLALHGNAAGARREGSRSSAVHLSAVYLLFLLVAVGLTVFSRSSWSPWWDLDLNAHKVQQVVLFQVLSLAPVPRFTVEFWNTLALLGNYGMASPLILYCAAIGIVLCVKVTLSRTAIGFWAFAFAAAAMLALQYVKVFGVIRYSGHLFLFLLACIWLGHGPWKSDDAPGYFTLPSRTLFHILLAANVAAAAVAGYYHATAPFSGGRDMAAFIREQGMEERPIIGHENYTTTTVSGYLGRKIYHVQSGRAESFMRWDRDSQRKLTWPEVVAFRDALAARTGQSPLVLLNFPWNAAGLKPLHRTSGAIVADENYYLYEWSPSS